MNRAQFWKKKEDKKVQCELCPHRCVIIENKRGFCGVRENKDGVLYTLVYGLASSICADPIEKKPLYHYHPGEYVLSFSTVGCNLKCNHCQNYSISQASADNYQLEKITAEEIFELMERYDCQGIAWTYNEPTIWYEFIYDASKIIKENYSYTTYITNGYINDEPLKKLAPYLDAANIDVKSFTERFYKEVCSGSLSPVLDTVKLAKKLGIYIELTYLVIPGYNDSMKEIEEFCSWVKNEVGEDTVVHFSRFYPHYKMSNIDPTPIETLTEIYNFAKKYLNYVYLGNVPHDNYDNTYCKNCKSLLIERHYFSSKKHNLRDGKCTRCNTENNIVVI